MRRDQSLPNGRRPIATARARLLVGGVLQGERLRLLRYFLAGVTVSVGYTITVVGLVEWLGWRNPVAANAASFALWTPVSYLAHREFTFRFDGDYAGSAARFLITFLVKLLASVVVMIAVIDILHAHYLVGVLLNWIVVPLVSYVALDLWVFR
jgi:putative flippase GtrA